MLHTHKLCAGRRRLSSRDALALIPELRGAIGLDIGGTLTKMVYLHPAWWPGPQLSLPLLSLNISAFLVAS